MSIVKLDSKYHDRNSFDCGSEPLNAYLKLYANQQSKKDLTRTYVLTDDKELSKILGFYTITMSYVKLADEKILPVALIGRLGVDKAHQRKGYGEYLLVDALLKLLKASEIVGFSHIVVDAKDGVGLFYEKFGFIPFHEEKNKLFMTVKNVRKSFQ